MKRLMKRSSGRASGDGVHGGGLELPVVLGDPAARGEEIVHLVTVERGKGERTTSALDIVHMLRCVGTRHGTSHRVMLRCVRTRHDTSHRMDTAVRHLVYIKQKPFINIYEVSQRGYNNNNIPRPRTGIDLVTAFGRC